MQYMHFHSLYITSHYYAKFKENPCVGTDARPPLKEKCLTVRKTLKHWIFVELVLRDETFN